MSDKKEKEIIMVEGLGEVELLRKPSVDKDGNPVAGVFTMSQKNLEKFYEEHGIPEPKKVFGAIDDARAEFAVAAATFLKPHVIEDKNDWELRAGTGNGRLTASIDAEKQVRNVSTGEVTTRHAVFTMKVQSKAPSGNEMLNKQLAEMEAALKG